MEQIIYRPYKNKISVHCQKLLISHGNTKKLQSIYSYPLIQCISTDLLGRTDFYTGSRM